MLILHFKAEDNAVRQGHAEWDLLNEGTAVNDPVRHGRAVMTMLEASSPAPAVGCIVQQMGVGGSSDTTSLGLWPRTKSGVKRAQKASKPTTQGARQHQGCYITPEQSVASEGTGDLGGHKNESLGKKKEKD